jgi:integrase/recombinase XerD
LRVVPLSSPGDRGERELLQLHSAPAPILIRSGLASEPKRKPFTDDLAGYDKYMAEVKGLSEETRAIHRRVLASVLQALMPRGRFEPARMTGVALQSHVSALAATRSPHTVHRTVVAIRDFLRFLQTRGIDATKALAMLKGPKVVSPLSSRKALTVPQMRALLAPLMPRELLAMRDLAIVLLLGQVGLRRADVAKLTIHDFDGRTGILRVQRSKSRRAFELPVPDEAREAILRYVRHGRPKVATSALFVTHAFPYDAGITASGVSGLVARAFRRSGVEHSSYGAHVLRHTLATHLVAAKQPLKAIADVMRHRAIDTTVRYTRVDLDRLRAAVCPWPEEPTDVHPRTT